MRRNSGFETLRRMPIPAANQCKRGGLVKLETFEGEYSGNTPESRLGKIVVIDGEAGPAVERRRGSMLQRLLVAAGVWPHAAPDIFPAQSETGPAVKPLAPAVPALLRQKHFPARSRR